MPLPFFTLELFFDLRQQAVDVIFRIGGYLLARHIQNVFQRHGLNHAHHVLHALGHTVSSANRDAVLEEWGKYGLLDHVDLALAQDAGSKQHCIAMLLEKGYTPDHVMMVGGAPGDRASAQSNDVSFYPILVKKGAAS